MNEYSDRFVKVADGFSLRVNVVPIGAWDNPTPCEGWVARDIVRHLVEWVPGFFTGMAGLAFPAIPSVDVDPVRAWSTLRDALESHLADEAVATREFDAPMGRMSIEAAIDMIVTGDVFLHTWDLARSTGLDETLDPEVCAAVLKGMEPMDEILRSSGHYGPRVVVSEDADAQTKLIAFIGRNPARSGVA
jgi:uncharacterized protein (TIGR03086 family)